MEPSEIKSYISKHVLKGSGVEIFSSKGYIIISLMDTRPSEHHAICVNTEDFIEAIESNNLKTK